MDHDQRRGLRFRAEFETLYSADREEGAGVLSQISYSGALVEEVASKPKEGSALGLYVFLQPVSPVHLVGEVVRHTDTGFAVHFPDPTDELRQLVDDIGALVSVKRRG